MNKIIIGILTIAVILPFTAQAASVTADTIPTVCSSAVFRGTAGYSVPDTLRIKLNEQVIATFSSGDSSWQVTSSGPFLGQNTLVAEVASTTAGVIALTSQSFGATCGNMDPMAIMQSWGLTGYQTPLVSVGVTVTDKYGFKGVCERWMSSFLGCFNISDTEDYLSGIRKAFGLK